MKLTRLSDVPMRRPGPLRAGDIRGSWSDRLPPRYWRIAADRRGWIARPRVAARRRGKSAA